MIISSEKKIQLVERKNFLNLKKKFFITELHKSQDYITQIRSLDFEKIKKIEEKKNKKLFPNEKISSVIIYANTANDLQILKILEKKNSEKENESTADILRTDINDEVRLKIEPLSIKGNKFMRLKTHFKIFGETIFFTSIPYSNEEMTRIEKSKKNSEVEEKNLGQNQHKFSFKIAKEVEENLLPVQDFPSSERNRLLKNQRKSHIRVNKSISKIKISKKNEIKQYHFSPECGFTGMVDIGGIVDFICDHKEKYLYVLTLNGEIHSFNVKSLNHCGLLDLGKFEDEDAEVERFEVDMGFGRKKSKKKKRNEGSSDSESEKEEDRKYSAIVIDKISKYALVSSYKEDDSLVDNNLVAFFTLLAVRNSKLKKLDTYSIKIPAHNDDIFDFKFLHCDTFLDSKKRFPLFVAISSYRGYFISFFVRKEKLVICTQLQDLGPKDIEIVDTCYKENLSYVLYGSKGEIILVEPKRPVEIEDGNDDFNDINLNK